MFWVFQGRINGMLFAATNPSRANSFLIWAQACWIAFADHPRPQTLVEHDYIVAMTQKDWYPFKYITGAGVGTRRDADPSVVKLVSQFMRAVASPSAV